MFAPLITGVGVALGCHSDNHHHDKGQKMIDGGAGIASIYLPLYCAFRFSTNAFIPSF